MSSVNLHQDKVTKLISTGELGQDENSKVFKCGSIEH